MVTRMVLGLYKDGSVHSVLNHEKVQGRPWCSRGERRRIDGSLSSSRSCSAIVVLDPDDIILAKIATGLDLDQLQVDLAGILQTMLRSDRDIDRFVLVYGFGLFSDHDPGRAADDN